MPPRATFTDSFEFDDAGRSFVCSREVLRASSDEAWWWFRVSTDSQNRYAPFRAEAGDTKASVQARIVAYWDELLVRRAAPPPERMPQRGRPPKAVAAAAAEAAEALDEE
ncbi:MAG TPA: hypothetical protein VE967_01770 [Gemmatimonadaceae bacterium]|nr:hypothetical protein [Gemmatimonadaceae bacterium]